MNYPQFAETTVVEQQPLFPKGTALLVDDNDRYLSMLTRFMQSMGFQCLQARDGAEALKLLESGSRPALIMCDVRMPNMNGLQFLEAMQSRSIVVPTIMISAVGERQIIAQCLALGASDYVEKPFQLEQVRTRIARVMERARPAGENSAP